MNFGIIGKAGRRRPRPGPSGYGGSSKLLAAAEQLSRIAWDAGMMSYFRDRVFCKWAG